MPGRHARRFLSLSCLVLARLLDLEDDTGFEASRGTHSQISGVFLFAVKATRVDVETIISPSF